MRTSRPSTRAPEAGVTVTVTGRGGAPPPPAAASTAAATARDPQVLQLARIGSARCNATQVAGHRVTAAALRGEERLAGGRVANEHLFRRHHFADRRPTLRARLCERRCADTPRSP